jgi:hypothetical protein
MPSDIDSKTRKQIRGLSKSLGSDVISLVETAVAVGWKVHIVDPRNLTLIPPVPGKGKRIHFNANQKHVSPRRQYAAVLRWGNKEQVELLKRIAHDHGSSDDDFGAAVKIMAAMNVDTVEGSVRVDDFTPPPPKKRHQRPRIEPQPVTTTKVAPKPTPVPAPPVRERRVIHEAPLLMHYSLSRLGGKSYPSPTTLVRKYSDGTEVYACAVSTCDREVPAKKENRRSMGGAHWGMHVRRGEAEPVDQSQFKGMAVADPDYTEHDGTRIHNGRRASKISRIASFLKGLDLANLTPDQIAEAIVDHLTADGSGEMGDIVELTPEQVLERIRRLVDRGHYVEQESKIVVLEEDLEVALEAAAKAEANAANLQARIDLMKEALNLEGDEE